MRNTEPLTEQTGLRAFAGAGGTYENQNLIHFGNQIASAH
jgi:hypothetical protein